MSSPSSSSETFLDTDITITIDDSEVDGMLRHRAHAPSTSGSNFTDTQPREANRNDKNKRSNPKSFTSLRLICIVLHGFLVIIHLILVVVRILRLEHRAIVPLRRQGVVSTAIIVFLQAFITLYSMVLLVVTQQLALRQNLVFNETLTAAHDKSTAWSGLGSALLTLYRQTSIVSSIWGTSVVTLYLACMAALHISFPSLFNLELFDQSGKGVVPTLLGIPSITINKTIIDPINVLESWSFAAEALPTLARLPEASMLGLRNGSVYDIVQGSERGNESIVVNSTSYHASCGLIPNATNYAFNKNDHIWNIEAMYEDYSFYIEVERISPEVIKVAHVYEKGWDDKPNTCNQGQTFLGRNVLFYSSAKFIDSAGAPGSVVTLNPPMQSFNRSEDIHAIQIIGCTFFLSHNRSAQIDPKLMLPRDPPIKEDRPEWKVWRPQIAAGVKDNSDCWSIFEDPLLDALGEAFESGVGSHTLYTSECLRDDSCLLSTLEEFLHDWMGIYPDYLKLRHHYPTHSLHILEGALESLAATLYWTLAHVPQSRIQTFAAYGSPGYGLNSTECAICISPAVGEARISVLASRLNLTTPSLFAGLVAALILLVLAIVLINNPNGHKAPVDTIGILQILWLSRQRPELLEAVSSVSDPSIHMLRAAGMLVLQGRSEIVPLRGGDSSDE